MLDKFAVPTRQPCCFSSRKSTTTGRPVAIKSLEALDQTPIISPADDYLAEEKGVTDA